MDIIELQRGRTRAFIAPQAGGRLLQLEIRDDGHWLPLLHAPPDPAETLRDPLSSSSYAMAPWPNRIDGGRFTWRGRMYDLERDGGDHALHGIGIRRPWTVEAVTPHSCRLSLAFDAAWPFGGRAVQEFDVLDDGIAQRIEVHAMRRAFPAGVGWHPWFRRDVRRGHDVRVIVDADQYYETVDMIATGWLKPAVREHDLRRGEPLAHRRLDACYRHPRGPLRIRWGDIELCMEQSPNVTHAVVYTPAHAVCVEPQTCAIDAFNLAAQGIDGTGVAVVEPWSPLVAGTAWRWCVDAAAAGRTRTARAVP